MTMDRPFYLHNNVVTTYSDFAHQVELRAKTLLEWRGQTVGLWIDHNPDFIINLFSVWEAGAVPILLSRRLPWTTVHALLDKANANLLITADEIDQQSVTVLSPSSPLTLKNRDIKGASQLPEIGSEQHKSALVLHTSGTTGLPKLVYVSRSNLESSLSLLRHAWSPFWTENDISLGWLPLFHSFGLISEMLCCYQFGSTYHFLSAPNPFEIVKALKQQKITFLFAVPWMLQQIVEIPSGLDALKRVRFVITGGALLRDDVGEMLSAAGVRVVQNYGMTEIGCAFLGSLHGGAWRDLHPLIPEEFWHLEAGSGQLIIHSACPSLTSSIKQDFPTNDVFARVDNGALHYICRVDDIIVQSNGEKTSVTHLEQKLLSKLCGILHYAVIVGTDRLQLACILQLKSGVKEDRETILAAVESLNLDLPSHSHIRKELVLVLKPEDGKCLPLTSKGSVARKEAEQHFSKDLEKLYSGASTDACGLTLESFICQRFTPVRDRSLFTQGLDSLDAVSLALHMAKIYPDLNIPLNIVYQYPTLELLERYLSERGSENVLDHDLPSFPSYTATDQLSACYDYRAPRRILLTGATGFIGRELLKSLVACESVEHVYCPVRRGTTDRFLSAKATYYEGYLFTDSLLGLSTEVYEDLLGSVDTVIHGAWPVDFNSTYAQLAVGTNASIQHLIDFCRYGDKALHFLSSLVTMMLHPEKDEVDEGWPLPTAIACLPHGYAETKWVAEHMIIRSGVRHKIFRLGQISAHSRTGQWNDREHVPNIINASRDLGFTPLLPLPVDWVPVDIACQAMIELMSVKGLNLHHIVNPNPRPAHCLSLGSPYIQLSEWIEKVSPVLDRYPTLMASLPFLAELVTLYDRIRPLKAPVTVKHSPTLAGCLPISDEYIALAASRIQVSTNVYQDR